MSTPFELEDKVAIKIMGNVYMVPSSLTIMKALEHSGYRLTRGAGCRGGVCGACVTVYRFDNSNEIHTCLACQTKVEPGMNIYQMHYYPSHHPVYDIDRMQAKVDDIIKVYPEITSCMGCNTCTRMCPQDIKVMDAISAILRGEFDKVTELSFECIMCGMCESRCPAELAPQQINMLVRRLEGRYLRPEAPLLKSRLEEIRVGKYNSFIKELKGASPEELEQKWKAIPRPS